MNKEIDALLRSINRDDVTLGMRLILETMTQDEIIKEIDHLNLESSDDLPNDYPYKQEKDSVLDPPLVVIKEDNILWYCIWLEYINKNLTPQRYEAFMSQENLTNSRAEIKEF